MKNGRFLLVFGFALAAAAGEAAPRRLPLAEYRDRVKAGWIGQMAGVAWGAPTEFKFKDRLLPAEALPAWSPALINDAYNQDDLYVEMTFLRTLEQHGLEASIRDAGIDFANSRYPLWCANKAGRTNLRRGIAPPDSGHPQFSRCPNDIDYQIEADYSGLIAPGLPQAAVDLGWTFGRLMNYGDGVYAGQFVGGMYAEAFFETNLARIVEAGLACIPSESQYAGMVRDLLAWWRAEPADWEKTWRRCQAKYRENPEHQKGSNGGIDCRINGAYVLMGLLYGGGDPDRTIGIACRCGQDSDCNPSSAAGVLFTTLGFSRIPQRFTQALDEKPQFSHTAYSLPRLLDVCERLARQAAAKHGGRVDRDAAGAEVFVLPRSPPVPSPLQRSWDPTPPASSRFTPEERARIAASDLPDGVREAVASFAPGWTISDCGDDMNPGLREQELGRRRVLVTHPLDRDTACVLRRRVDVPATPTVLRLAVGHHPQGDWRLRVRADGKELRQQIVGRDSAPDGWVDVEVDLSPFAGRSIDLELVNEPTGWSWEAAYWSRVELAPGPATSTR